MPFVEFSFLSRKLTVSLPVHGGETIIYLSDTRFFIEQRETKNENDSSSALDVTSLRSSGVKSQDAGEEQNKG
jgi:hypothetical protein